MSGVLVIIALILGALGSYYAIFIGRKPLKDYCVEFIKNMWWNRCFGNKRIKWLKTLVVNNIVKRVPLENEAIRMWNIICLVIDSTNFHTLSEQDCEDLTYCLSKCCYKYNSDDNSAPKQCQFHAEFVFEIVELMSLDASICAWKLVKYIVDVCCSPVSDLQTKRNYKSRKFLEDLINNCDVQDNKLIVVAEIAVELGRKYTVDKKLYPSRVTNKKNIAFLQQHLDSLNFDRLTT